MADRAQIVARDVTPDSDRYEEHIVIRDPDGIEHAFDCPKGADVPAFEAEMQVVVLHRYNVRRMPGDA